MLTVIDDWNVTLLAALINSRWSKPVIIIQVKRVLHSIQTSLELLFYCGIPVAYIIFDSVFKEPAENEHSCGL